MRRGSLALLLLCACYRTHTIDAEVHEGGLPDAPDAPDAAGDTDAGPPLGNPAVVVASGNETTCVVRAEGDVWCWGRGEDGELGRGLRDRSDRPVRIAGLPPAAGVFLGGSHVCANEPGSGVLHCWGSNGFAQIDVALGRHVLSPTAVSYGGRVFTAGLGTRHTCAGVVHDFGYAVRCRGTPLEGQFAGAPVGADGTAELPVPRAFAIASEDKSTCATTLEGVFCWGGSVDPATPRTYRRALVRVADATAESVAVGRADLLGAGRECGAFEGALRCWDRGPAASAAPVAAPSVRKITLRHHVLCGIVAGRAHCAGRNFAGQLGNGRVGDDGETQRDLRPVRLDRDVRAIAAGDRHVCAIDLGGRVWCWGSNEHGQLGRPGESSGVPVVVPLPD